MDNKDFSKEKNNLSQEFSNYVPTIFLKDGTIFEQKTHKVSANLFKQEIFKEVDNIKHYSTLLKAQKLLFSGYEKVTRDKQFKYELKTFLVKEPMIENDIFEVKFYAYDIAKQTVINTLNSELRWKKYNDKNNKLWLERNYVQNKYQKFIAQYHNNQNFSILINGNKVLISNKRLEFYDWQKPYFSTFQEEKNTQIYLYAKYDQNHSLVKFKVTLEGKKKERKKKRKKRNKDKGKTSSDNWTSTLGGIFKGLFAFLMGLLGLLSLIKKIKEIFDSIDENCNYKEKDIKNLQNKIREEVEKSLAKICQKIFDELAEDYLDDLDNVNLIQEQEKDIIQKKLTNLLMEKNLWNEIFEKYKANEAEKIENDFYDQFKDKLINLELETITNLNQKIDTALQDHLNSNAKNLVEKNNDFLTKKLKKDLLDDESLVNNVTKNRLEIFDETLDDFIEQTIVDSHDEVLDELVNIFLDKLEYSNQNKKDCVEKMLQEAINALLNEFFYSALKKQCSVTHSLFIFKEKPFIKNQIVENTFFTSNFNQITTEKESEISLMLKHYLNFLVTKTRDKIIVKYLKNAIKNNDNKGYELVKSDQYGDFDKTVTKYYYVLSIKKIYRIEIDLPKPDDQKIEKLITYLQQLFADSLISKLWYENLQETDKEKLNKKIMQLIIGNINKKVTIDNKEIYFETKHLTFEEQKLEKNKLIVKIRHDFIEKIIELKIPIE